MIHIHRILNDTFSVDLKLLLDLSRIKKLCSHHFRTSKKQHFLPNNVTLSLPDQQISSRISMTSTWVCHNDQVTFKWFTQLITFWEKEALLDSISSLLELAIRFKVLFNSDYVSVIYPLKLQNIDAFLDEVCKESTFIQYSNYSRVEGENSNILYSMYVAPGYLNPSRNMKPRMQKNVGELLQRETQNVCKSLANTLSRTIKLCKQSK